MAICRVEYIKKRIEKSRKELHNLKDEMNIEAKAVIKKSKKIDKLINTYYRNQEI